MHETNFINCCKIYSEINVVIYISSFWIQTIWVDENDNILMKHLTEFLRCNYFLLHIPIAWVLSAEFRWSSINTDDNNKLHGPVGELRKIYPHQDDDWF